MSNVELNAPEATTNVAATVPVSAPKDVMRLDPKYRSENTATAGSLENWKAAANTVFTTPRLEHVALVTLTGCAGVIIQRCGYDTFCLHIYGPTSMGKTMGQVGAAAMWADTKENKGVLFTLRQTDNALEYPFVRGNGSSVHFDEGKSGPEALANLVWLASGGTSKGRMRADGGMRKALTWSTFCTATSEEPLQKYMHDAKKTVLGGVLARMIIIDITGQPLVDPVDAKRIKDAFQNNYGHAGPEFVREFIRLGYARDPQKLKDRIDEFVTKLTVKGDGGVMLRANTILAVLWASGEIMKSAGLLADGVDVERIIRWAAGAASRSVEAGARDVGKDAARSVLEWYKLNPQHVQRLGGQGGPPPVGAVDPGVSFISLSTETPNRIIRGFLDNEGTLYIPKKVLENFPDDLGCTPAAVLDVFDRQDLLVKQGKNRVWSKVPGVPGSMPNYRVKFDGEGVDEIDE